MIPNYLSSSGTCAPTLGCPLYLRPFSTSNFRHPDLFPGLAPPVSVITFCLSVGLPVCWSFSTHTSITRSHMGRFLSLLLLMGSASGMCQASPVFQTALSHANFVSRIFFHSQYYQSFRLSFAPEGVGGELEMINSQISSITPFKPIWIFLLDYFLIRVWVILPPNSETIWII